jgi:hypothetical protein
LFPDVYLFQQDLTNNPEYSLIISKGTAAMNYFKNSNQSSGEKYILWKRMEENMESLPETSASAEKMMLKNPNLVFFAPKLMMITMTKHYPCLISVTSKPLLRVIIL